MPFVPNSFTVYVRVWMFEKMGRTIPTWRMVVEDELRILRRFREFLRSEDKEVFDDQLNQCRLYASYASSMASSVKEIPLIMAMLFGQHKRLMELETRIRLTENTTQKPP